MSSSKAFVYCLIVGTVFGIPSTARGQSLRELARIQAAHNPGVPLQHITGPEDYPPKSVEEVASEAMAVVRARLSVVKSYLSNTEDRVLTDYLITEPTVITGRLPVLTERIPKAAAPLILTVLGGEVTVEGVLIRSTDPNRAPIKDGAQYFVFLRQSRQPDPGRYEVYYGGIFEVVQDQVTPLLKNADIVFQESVDKRPKDFVARIQKTTQPR